MIFKQAEKVICKISRGGNFFNIKKLSLKFNVFDVLNFLPISQRSPAIVAVLPSPKEEAHWLFKMRNALPPR